MLAEGEKNYFGKRGDRNMIFDVHCKIKTSFIKWQYRAVSGAGARPKIRKINGVRAPQF